MPGPLCHRRDLSQPRPHHRKAIRADPRGSEYASWPTNPLRTTSNRAPCNLLQGLKSEEIDQNPKVRTKRIDLARSQPEKPLERPRLASYLVIGCGRFSPGLPVAIVRIVDASPSRTVACEMSPPHAAMPPHRVCPPIACRRHRNESYSLRIQTHFAYAPSVNRWHSNIRAFSLPR